MNTLDPWAKDCSCEHHRGPCWLYRDFEHHQSLREHFATVGTLRSYAIEESDRIRAKLAHMHALGVTKIPKEITAQIEADWCNAPLVFSERVRREAAARLARIEKTLEDSAFEHDLCEGSARAELSERITALHAEAAGHRTVIAQVAEVLARGPRSLMTTEELLRGALPRFSDDDRRALLATVPS